MTLAANNFSGAVNLGTGDGVSVGEIVRTLGELIGQPGLVDEKTSATPDPFGYIVADAQRLRALGWSPQVSLREGLQQLIQHMK